MSGAHWTPPPPPTPAGRSWVLVTVLLTAAGFGLGLLIGLNASDGASADSGPASGWDGADASTVLGDVAAWCAPDSLYVEVLDDGAGLSVSGTGNESEGASLTEVACVLAELEVPESVLSRIDRTRALDGTQDASWGDLDASWTYHPDSGLSLIIETQS